MSVIRVTEDTDLTLLPDGTEFALRYAQGVGIKVAMDEFLEHRNMCCGRHNVFYRIGTQYYTTLKNGRCDSALLTTYDIIGFVIKDTIEPAHDPLIFGMSVPGTQSIPSVALTYREPTGAEINALSVGRGYYQAVRAAYKCGWEHRKLT